MWKRVNPNVEYVIAAMRKKGEDIKNGISKVRCPEKGKPAAKKKCHSRIRPCDYYRAEAYNLISQDASLCGDKPLPGAEVKRR